MTCLHQQEQLNGLLVFHGAKLRNRHNSTASCNKLHRLVYKDCHRDEHVEWEPFHKSEAAMRSSIDKSEMCKEMLAIGRAMSQHFGYGCGRILYRSVISEMQEDFGHAAQVGGTRKGEALANVAANILSNYRAYAVGLHAKVKEKQRGHGSSSQKSLLTLGRRLLSVDLVIFTLAMSDIMRDRQKPWTLMTQRSGQLPWVLHRYFLKRQERLQEDVNSLREVRRLASLLTLLQHYVDPGSLKRFMFAQLFTSSGRRWYETTRHLFSVVPRKKSC